MVRNAESRFAELPGVDMPRSIFDRSSGHLTSFNIGELIPVYVDSDILPGDTVKMTSSIVARLQTLLTPMMGDIQLEFSWWFIPHRLTWNHWKEFMGENTQSAWIPETEYSIPKISSPEGGWSVGSIADYMGIPPLVEFSTADGTDGLAPMALPFRAYALVCQEWWRDQNLSDPLNIPLGDANQSGSNGDNYITDVANGGKPFKVAKYHDLFTSCLPAAQKHEPISFGTQVLASGDLPVRAMFGKSIDSKYFPADVSGELHGLKFTKSDGSEINGAGGYYSLGVVGAGPSDASDGSVGFYGSSYSGAAYPVAPSNLFADSSSLTLSGVSFTINELRLAFQMQKFWEKMARAGSRYRESILEMFGTHSPDARMMIPEYLGGHRFPLQIHQIANTSQSSDANLGDLGAMSNTSDISEDFVHSFTEHGTLLGCVCARYNHVYSQSLNRMWTRENMLDFYFPVFSSIGEQPRYVYEIDATKREGENRKDVFGYNEAWAEYRFRPSTCSSEMRPGVPNSLASWHLADYYGSAPRLSDAWIREDKSNVDRVLAVTSALANQIFADIWFDATYTRVMPTFSVPGLIDHF